MGVQKIIKLDFVTASFNELTTFPGNLSFLILDIFFFDFSNK